MNTFIDTASAHGDLVTSHRLIGLRAAGTGISTALEIISIQYPLGSFTQYTLPPPLEFPLQESLYCVMKKT